MEWNAAYGVRTWFLIEPLRSDISEVTESADALIAFFNEAVEATRKAKEQNDGL